MRLRDRVSYLYGSNGAFTFIFMFQSNSKLCVDYVTFMYSIILTAKTIMHDSVDGLNI